MKVSQAFIERGIREIQRALKEKGSRPIAPEIFLVTKDVEDIEQYTRGAHDKCNSMRPERFPVLIHFVGPDEGTEHGMGPLEDECKGLQ